MMFKLSASAVILSLLVANPTDARLHATREHHVTRDAATKLSLGFAHEVKLLTGSKTLPQLDRERAVSFMRNQTSKASAAAVISSNVNANNTAVTYTTSVGIGSPPTQSAAASDTLLIDTGSSNTWVGAKGTYVKTGTAKKTGGHVKDTGVLTSGPHSVTIAPGLTVTNQTIAYATKSSGFSDIDGILGIGPVDLSIGSDSTQGLLPTITDNLFAQHKIPNNEIGIFFKPAQSSGGEGELTWGGIDKTKVTGSVNYVSITATNPAGSYWGIDQSMTYGNTTIFEKASGIVDTGTTLILIATNYFRKYQESLGVGSTTLDKATGLIMITPAQYAKLKPLNFKIGKHTYTLSPNAQIFPRALAEQIGGKKGSIYLVVGDLGSAGGQGLDFINGYAFL
ncbi:hypothetical protein HWV62_36432 [Athelia sp. TMB]|nr:hypothetical protein HWV62_36432 [Athelia sp. TMB]